MKKKTIIAIAGSVILVVIVVLITLHFRKKRAADTSGIYAFLNEFNVQLKKKNMDSVMFYFDPNLRGSQEYRLLAIRLMGFKQSEDGADTDPFVTLTLGSSDIKTLNPTTSEVTVPAVLSFEKLETRNTELTLKLVKQGDSYKITQVTAKRFLLDYVTYSNYIKDKTLRDEDRFSPETLAAFKVANQLKAKYDSVIWFDHFNGQPYYYVVKGKWEGYSPDSANYKMGLVGPDQKEIIPVEFALIHNISATFDNLVEVEKDHKRGFYDLAGKNVLPVEYDGIYPVSDAQSIAVLKKGDDLFWLKNDYSVSEKTNLKMADIITNIKKTGPFNMTGAGLGDKNIMEFNSRDIPGSIYIAPSYLVDLNLIDPIKQFKNPLRKRVEYDDVSKQYLVQPAINTRDAGNNWLTATFYKIRDYFLGGRSEFYEKKNMVLTDAKRNKVYTADISVNNVKEENSDGMGEGAVCDVNLIKALSDSLFEIKSGSNLYAELYDSTKTIAGGVYYHYFTIKNGKLVNLRNDRVFGFTKYVKMNDSYLKGCYNISEGREYKNLKYHTVNTITPEMLTYMKNEIYADYKYRFKDKRWQSVFMDWYQMDDDKTNATVDDSLTVIDKYNLNFISQKLNTYKSDRQRGNLK